MFAAEVVEKIVGAAVSNYLQTMPEVTVQQHKLVLPSTSFDYALNLVASTDTDCRKVFLLSKIN